MNSIISLIVAAADNNVIGINNDMPWHIPEDFKHFKSITMGKPCIMGRKTFESIVAQLGKPLPGRKNLVVTRNPSSPHPKFLTEISSLPPYKGGGLGWGDDVIAFPSLLSAIEHGKNDAAEIMIIGGAQIYAQALEQNLVDKIYLTRVHQLPEGDAFFPELGSEWQEISRDERDGFSFLELIKK